MGNIGMKIHGKFPSRVGKRIFEHETGSTVLIPLDDGPFEVTVT